MDTDTGQDIRQLKCYKVKIDRSWKRNIWARHAFQAILDRHYDYLFHTTPDSELAQMTDLDLRLKMNGRGAVGVLTVLGINGDRPINVAAQLDR